MTRSRWTVTGLVVAGLTAGIVIGAGADRLAMAQQSGIKRTPLQTIDEPGAPAYQAVMGVAEIAAGATSGRHFHHGVEIGYVLDGTVLIEQQGHPPQTVKAGEPFRIDPNAPHESKATAGPVKILTVHLVEKGKPLAEPAK